MDDPSKSMEFNVMQCPYTWDECSTKFEEIDWVQHLLTKLAKPDCNTWRLYSLKVLLGCIYGHIKNEKKANETFESCKRLVDENSCEEFFQDIVEGMRYVIFSSEYHMNKYNGKEDIAAGLSSSIQPFENLSKESQAAVYATKAYILREFGYDGLKQALQYSELATVLDPDEDGARQGAWYYLTGKILAEIRRAISPNNMPSKKELKILERSIKINPFPIHAVVLADSYRFSAKCLSRIKMQQNKEIASIINKSRKTSLNLYEEAMRGPYFTVSILSRCGMGLMKLPAVVRNVELAETALKMGYEIYPEDSSILCGLGFLELWHKNDYNAALKYFEQSYKHGNQLAGVHMILIRYKIDNTYNPLNDCDECIEKLQSKLKSRISLDEIVNFLAVKGYYYLNVEKNFLKAAKEWEKAIDALPDSTNLLETRSDFSNEKKVISHNIYNILIERIQKKLKYNMNDMKDEVYLKELLKKCEEKMAEMTSSESAMCA